MAFQVPQYQAVSFPGIVQDPDGRAAQGAILGQALASFGEKMAQKRAMEQKFQWTQSVGQRLTQATKMEQVTPYESLSEFSYLGDEDGKEQFFARMSQSGATASQANDLFRFLTTPRERAVMDPLAINQIMAEGMSLGLNPSEMKMLLGQAGAGLGSASVGRNDMAEDIRKELGDLFGGLADLEPGQASPLLSVLNSSGAEGLFNVLTETYGPLTEEQRTQALRVVAQYGLNSKVTDTQLRSLLGNQITTGREYVPLKEGTGTFANIGGLFSALGEEFLARTNLGTIANSLDTANAFKDITLNKKDGYFYIDLNDAPDDPQYKAAAEAINSELRRLNPEESKRLDAYINATSGTPAGTPVGTPADAPASNGSNVPITLFDYGKYISNARANMAVALGGDGSSTIRPESLRALDGLEESDGADKKKTESDIKQIMHEGLPLPFTGFDLDTSSPQEDFRAFPASAFKPVVEPPPGTRMEQFGSEAEFMPRSKPGTFDSTGNRMEPVDETVSGGLTRRDRQNIERRRYAEYLEKRKRILSMGGRGLKSRMKKLREEYADVISLNEPPKRSQTAMPPVRFPWQKN